MKNKLFIILLFFLLFITPIKSSNVKNLFIIYMAADNDLYMHAIDDIKELESVDKVNSKVVTLLDGVDKTYIYEILFNNKKLLKSFENLNSGDPKVLTDLILFSLNRYKPENIILVLWGHGDGRNFKGSDGKGVCFDESYLDFLTIKEIKDSLNDIYKVRKVIIDLLIFDACFMQTIEVSYELKDYVKYIIASQSYVPLDGFPYDEIFKRINNKSLDILEIGKEIALSYFEYYKKEKNEVSVSLLETSISKEILNFTKMVVNRNYDKEYLIREREINLIPLNQKYVDYLSLFKNLLKEEEKLNLELIYKKFVIVNFNSFSKELNGFSIYFPPYYLPINLTFFSESGWEKFLWKEFTY